MKRNLNIKIVMLRNGEEVEGNSRVLRNLPINEITFQNAKDDREADVLIKIGEFMINYQTKMEKKLETVWRDIKVMESFPNNCIIKRTSRN
jgi:hypothetical protein